MQGTRTDFDVVFVSKNQVHVGAPLDFAAVRAKDFARELRIQSLVRIFQHLGDGIDLAVDSIQLQSPFRLSDWQC